ncbi:MAG: hypothetical protein M3320_05440, partial [Actinomycetota bacterium]|nr:hypothetical protein [Actinomycetota bacterium]
VEAAPQPEPEPDRVPVPKPRRSRRRAPSTAAPSDPIADILTSREGRAVLRGVFGMLRKRL